MNGASSTDLAHDILHCAFSGMLQSRSVERFVTACVPTVAPAMVRRHIKRAVAALLALHANNFAHTLLRWRFRMWALNLSASCGCNHHTSPSAASCNTANTWSLQLRRILLIPSWCRTASKMWCSRCIVGSHGLHGGT